MEKNLNNPQNPNADYFFFYLYPLHLFDSKAGRLQSARHPASLPTWPETPPQTSLQHCAPPLCYNTLLFFFSSCRARSRLGRSSKRLVVDQLFSRCKRTGEKQKARCLPKAETKQPPNTNTNKQTRNRGRHPEI